MTSLSEMCEKNRVLQKRFLFPFPRRRESHKGFMKKFGNKDFPKITASNLSSPSNTSPRRHLASLKVNEESKTRKEFSWARYVDPGGGRVTAVETLDELTVDLSKLFLGLKFAHGAHSWLYSGIYNDDWNRLEAKENTFSVGAQRNPQDGPIAATVTECDLKWTGHHEIADINTFSWGVANRGASVRVGRDTEKEGKGCFEPNVFDKRPNKIPSTNVRLTKATEDEIGSGRETVGFISFYPPVL